MYLNEMQDHQPPQIVHIQILIEYERHKMLLYLPILNIPLNQPNRVNPYPMRWILYDHLIQSDHHILIHAKLINDILQNLK